MDDMKQKRRKDSLPRWMPRVLRAAAGFAVVLTAYAAYALVAVPLIEPPVARRSTDSDLTIPTPRPENSTRRFASLFPADSWIFAQTPKILESEQGKLLFQDYKNLGGSDLGGSGLGGSDLGGSADGRHRVQLVPLAIVLTPVQDPDANADEETEPIVLEAPGGAVLEFDAPLLLSRMQIGRLIGGRLVGPVTIRGQGDPADPEDDLWITTNSVQLTEQYVTTSSAVDFRFGPHHGRGRGMTIKMSPGEESRRKDRRGPSVGGIASFELRHVERLYLEVTEDELESEPAVAASTQPIGNPSDDVSAEPPAKVRVEVTCAGPFRFDVADKVATFSDRVDVRRIHPNGPCDQLNCEELAIFFAPRAEMAESTDSLTPEEFDIEPRRLLARGNPVVIAAPSEEVYARGQRLEYDLQARAITLDAARGVVLRQGLSEIRAKRLSYRADPSGRLGDLTANGPGWIRAVLDDDRADEPFEAGWNELLKVRRYEGNPVASLYGNANLSSTETGRLDAPEIHFYLRETPKPDDPKKFDVRPDRMLACQANQMLAAQDPPTTNEAGRLRGMNHNILLRSPQVSAALRRLELWFEETDALAPTDTLPGDRPSVHGQEEPKAADRRNHFEVVGNLLQAKVLLHGKDMDPELSELTLEGGIRFVETQTAKPDEKPMILDGDRLHAVDVSRPHAAVTVTGRPAHFEARGLSLTGANINLNRGTNRLWIDGPGQMNVPMDKDFDNNPLSKPGTLTVDWQQRMAFDGRKASFDESVTATGPLQQLQTETLEVHFRHAIDFAAETFETDEPPEVQHIVCRGGVRMDAQTFEGPKQTSQQAMEVVDLKIDLDTGVLTAAGPGWINTVQYGSGDLSQLAGRENGATASGNRQGDAEELKCLHVKFRGSIQGNVRLPHRRMTFHDQVSAAYAPADRFDTMLRTNNPDLLGPEGVVMRCRQLAVNEMNATATQRGTIELEAQGNTVVEGVDFTARAIRMTYSQAKDLLILEGDGRTDAELFRQKQVGGRASQAVARKILYQPKTQQLRVEDARSFELTQFPGRR